MLNSKLRDKYLSLKELSKRFLGYPTNAAFDYSDLNPFLELPINNIGETQIKSNLQINTHDFEQEVIAYIAKLYGAEENYWGYVTNGGTEGNILGIHLGRVHYPQGIVYYSAHCHYSIAKAVSLTRSQAIEIAAQEKGEMDYAALKNALIANKNSPAIIVVNIGTTMTGAIDSIVEIKRCLRETGIREYFIHCDAALHGLILPFRQNNRFFKLADIDTMAISGHKLIGAPFPCGIFICNSKVIKDFGKYIEYVQVRDLTLSGSRNGFTPLILWHEFYLHSDNLRNKVSSALEKADYAIAEMNKKGIAAWRHEDSPIVVFKKPSHLLIEKWQLACYNDIAHIVTLSHVDRHTIECFIEDLVEDFAK